MKQTLLLLLATTTAFSQPSLPPTQEASPIGIIETKIPNGRLNCLGAALLPDGSLLASGGFIPDNKDLHQPLFLLRFLPDGRLDSLFGAQGAVLTDLGDHAYGLDVFPLPDGNILVTGQVYAETFYEENGQRYRQLDTDVLLLRYLPDGRLDPGFGQGGISMIRVGECKDNPTAVAYLPDGKILVAGRSCIHQKQQNYTCSGGYKGFIIRALPNGELDPAFGQGGKVFIETEDKGDFNEVYSLAVLPNGRVLAAVDLDSKPRLISIGQTGSFSFLDDKSWHLYWDTHNAQRESRALLPLPDSKFLFLRQFSFDDPKRTDGYTSHRKWILTRYLPDGRIDSTYARFGNAKSPLTCFSEFPYCLASDAKGAVFIGESGFLQKIDPDGNPDTLFFQNARIAAREMGECYELHLLPNGTILASGNEKMTLGRFLPDGSSDSSFGAAVREESKKRKELEWQRHGAKSPDGVDVVQVEPPPPMESQVPRGVQGSPDFLKSLGGFSARTPVKHPVPKLKIVVSGVVVTDVCIDRKGNVISVAYDAAKSSISDKSVVKEVMRTAKRYKFAPSSSNSPDCGEITFRFTSQ